MGVPVVPDVYMMDARESGVRICLGLNLLNQRSHFPFRSLADAIQFSDTQYIVRIIHKDNAGRRIHLGYDRLQFFILAQSTEEDDSGIAVVEDVQVFVSAQGRVDRYVYHTGHIESHVHKIPFRPVAAYRYGLVPIAIAQ